jgi:hypothetical protein
MNSRASAATETVIDVYLQASIELFSAYGLSTRLQRQEDAPNAQRSSYVSVLGATGEGIRFSSTLNAGADLLVRLHPSGARDVARRDLEDWCRELNNQLVGRVKNKLLRLDCQVTAGLPVLITGSGIDTVMAPEQEYRQYFFAGEHGSLVLTLALVLAPDLELKEVPASADDEAIRLEGEHALF